MSSGHQLNRSQHPLAGCGPCDVLTIESIGFLERACDAEDDLHLATSVAHVPPDRQSPVAAVENVMRRAWCSPGPLQLMGSSKASRTLNAVSLPVVQRVWPHSE